MNIHLPHLRVQSQGKNHLGSEEESQNIELLLLQRINGLHCYILQIVKQKHVGLCAKRVEDIPGIVFSSLDPQIVDPPMSVQH